MPCLPELEKFLLVFVLRNDIVTSLAVLVAHGEFRIPVAMGDFDFDVGDVSIRVIKRYTLAVLS